MMSDIDEKIEGMCNKCKNEIEKSKCNRCGEEVKKQTNAKNKSFDENKFKNLAGDVDG